MPFLPNILQIHTLRQLKFQQKRKKLNLILLLDNISLFNEMCFFVSKKKHLLFCMDLQSPDI